jgi:hypothetical protein
MAIRKPTRKFKIDALLRRIQRWLSHILVILASIVWVNQPVIAANNGITVANGTSQDQT